MRPKIVMLTLVVAVGLVALAAVMRGMVGRHADEAQPAPAASTGSESPAPATVAVAKPNNAADNEQLRAAQIEKELDEIRSAAIDGAGDPSRRSLLYEKVTHPEPAVRNAALQAVVSLDDTNAIPRLEEAIQVIEDPHEKVAVMDAIAYLKLPNVMPDTPGTNDLTPADVARFKARKSASDGSQGKQGRSARRMQRAQATGQPPGAATAAQPQAQPPNAATPPPQDQPATPDPAAPPPQ